MSKKTGAGAAAALAAVIAMAGCGDDEPAAPAAAASPESEAPAASADGSVFDPLVGTLERAESVQQTIDERAAEQRRLIEELEQ